MSHIGVLIDLAALLTNVLGITPILSENLYFLVNYVPHFFAIYFAAALHFQINHLVFHFINFVLEFHEVLLD